MTPRVNNPQSLAPETIKALYAVEASFRKSGLEHDLIELVKLRASQINGCAFCIHMHVSDGLKHGVAPMKLHLVAGWRESGYFTDRERAALGWTEAVTRIADSGAPDADYDAVAAAFSEAEQVQLTLLIGAINLWNRLSVSFRIPHPMAETRAAA